MVQVEVSVTFGEEGMMLAVIGLVQLLEAHGETGRQHLLTALKVVSETVAHAELTPPMAVPSMPAHPTVQ